MANDNTNLIILIVIVMAVLIFSGLVPIPGLSSILNPQVSLDKTEGNVGDIFTVTASGSDVKPGDSDFIVYLDGVPCSRTLPSGNTVQLSCRINTAGEHKLRPVLASFSSGDVLLFRGTCFDTTQKLDNFKSIMQTKDITECSNAYSGSIIKNCQDNGVCVVINSNSYNFEVDKEFTVKVFGNNPGYSIQNNQCVFVYENSKYTIKTECESNIIDDLEQQPVIIIEPENQTIEESITNETADEFDKRSGLIDTGIIDTFTGEKESNGFGLIATILIILVIIGLIYALVKN